ncbi:MAG: trypsin-like peptidase domain-containing protein [Candidatus Levybacteria bacterium]|nr:trypsin-like peptidase domain-containing protein [Candidatus Levybacteria bacterium]
MKKLVLLVGVLLVLFFILTGVTKYSPQILDTVSRKEIGNEKIKIVSEESVVTQVVKDVAPSVVTIAAVPKENSPQNQFNPFDFFGILLPETSDDELFDPSKPQNIGSGFIVTDEGFVVTNRHVISDTTLSYVVITNNGKQYKASKIYRDPLSDIGIVKIDPSENAGNVLKPVVMGDSSKLQVGQLAIAIGTALGEFNNTVTTGVISGLGRGITAGSVFEGTVEELSDVIQTDAAINPGNSGGPLLNSSGQVIGVNTAVSQSGQNIGFALPINTIKDSIKNFNATGQFSRPYLGVAYQMITRDVAIRNELPEGAYIQMVVPDSSADKAGLKRGDIIAKVDGQKLQVGTRELSTLIQKKKVGDTMTLEIYRENEDGSSQNFQKKVILQEAPQQ